MFVKSAGKTNVIFGIVGNEKIITHCNMKYYDVVHIYWLQLLAPGCQVKICQLNDIFFVCFFYH